MGQVGKQARILVVDDEERNRRLLVAMLEVEGYATVEAADGARALELTRQSPPDIVLLDIMMPGMDGYQVTRALKADTATKAIPVVMVTALDDRESRLRGLEAGAEEFVSKPVDRNELRIRVRNLLRLKEFSDYLANHNSILEAAVTARTADLRESERRFSEMLRNVELISVMLDREGRIEYCNEYLLRLTGWQRAEVIGRSWTELFLPPESGDLKERFVTILADLPEGRHGENMIVTRSGERRLVRWNNSLLRSGAGDVTGTASIGEDITDQRRGEEALRRFSAAMDATPDAIYLTDRTTMRFVHVNDAACRMQGLTRAELLALGPAELLSTSRAELEHTYDAMIASGVDAEPLELLRTRKDGLQVRLEVRRHAHRSGDRWMIVTLVRDITERKEAEARIVRLNRVYALLSGIGSAIVRIRKREELFSEVCRIAVSEGGFRLARVLEMDANAKVRIAASSEPRSELFQHIVDEYNSDPEHSQSLLAVAMRERQPVISNDVAADARMPHRAALTKEGNFALALLPIIVEQRIAGTVMLRTREAGTFDEAELHLLHELVSNLSFALENMDKEEKVQRLTRVHAVLSGINGAIVRIRDREALFKEACRIAVETGDFTLAWIGLVDGKANVLVPVAWAGRGREHADKLRLKVGDAAPDTGSLAAQAIRERRAAFSNDVGHDPRMVLLKEMVEQGLGSAVVLPLVVHGKALGALTLVAAENGFFDDDELTLLNEVTGNIAFALEHIEKEDKVQRLTRVYAVLSGINTLIVRVKDRDELFRESCRIAVEAGHFLKAWIGIVGPSPRPFRMVAAEGGDPAFFQNLERELGGKLLAGKGFVAQAMATREPVISNDARDDPEVLLREDIVGAGVRSIAVLPLVVAGEAVGVLTLNADAPGFFDEEEMKLLVELAGDIAFAIDHIEKQERLDYVAYYDGLTGLANRSLFLERVAQYMRSAAGLGHKLAVFLIDLERFRNINDSLGRPAGDALLKQVAEWLTRKATDANLLGRIGADHFAVVLPEVKGDGSAVARLIEKWMSVFLEHPFRLDDAVFRLAAKVGVAIFPEDGADADTLLTNAETALRKAKTAGHRYLFYTQTMADAMTGKLTMENQLRQALDNEEFVLHYQPKVNLQNGKLAGAEALIRWNDPRTGSLVPPGRFIPILEETGMIREVGNWALRKAIEDYLRWCAAGLPAVRIAVNVSPLQLQSRGFVAEIGEAIFTNPLAAAGLELEITESVIMQDVKHNIASLEAIRAMGVTIAIDDFGTGFSSLSHLARLPVDTLKIDRSFVIDMTGGPQGLALVSTIISLAHALKLKVVAEGVETEEQSRLLRLLSCDQMQGFLFSKPVPVEIFETRFLTRFPVEVAPADLAQAT